MNCDYCNLVFENKKLLMLHQKTKKCVVHREIGFVCQKCFKYIKGYENTLSHVNECNENLTEEGILRALINQLSLKYDVSLNLDDDTNSGVLTFKKLNNYIHPHNVMNGVNVPQKIHLFQKHLAKYTTDQIIGDYNLYINDLHHKIFRSIDIFQFLSVRYAFEDFLNLLWVKTTTPCISISGNIYLLGKVQCQNNEGKKWFGDTFLLKQGEQVVKCVWYQDNDLTQLFSCFRYILKDLLNLYLSLGNWALKQEKIKLKGKTDLKTKLGTIADVIIKHNLKNLVDTIQILNSYETFSTLVKKILMSQSTILHSNIDHIFKDDMTLPPIIDEDLLLMNMGNPNLIRSTVNGNCYHLMHYILSDSERKIFLSKE